MKRSCWVLGLVLVTTIATFSAILMFSPPLTWQPEGTGEICSIYADFFGKREHQGTLRVVAEERAWIISVQAPREKLASATAHVRGADAQTATRLNGGIVDRPDDALATLVVPRTTWAWEGRVVWVGLDGKGHGSGGELTGLALQLRPISDKVYRLLTR